MAAMYTPVSAIVAGKIKLKLKVRVLRLWSVPDFNNADEECFVHMLLLDDKNGKIQATAKKSLIPKVKGLVTEGCTYEVENVLVTRNDPKFQTTRHKYKLNLLHNTSWKRLDDDAIPNYHFDFVNFMVIVQSKNEGQYVDVIGHIVEKDEMKDKEMNGRTSKLIDLTLEDEGGNRVHCSLWGAYAVTINDFLSAEDQILPPVVVIQLAKLKKYYGTMGVCNAFHGTKILLDNSLPDIVEYRKRIEGLETQMTQGISQASGSLLVPLADDLMQTKMMTIEDLIESQEKCIGVVLGTVCDIESEHGWYYEACTRCAGRVTIVAGRMFCSRCNQSRNAVPRYKVHVQVIDPTGSSSFILFDRNVQNYVGRSVQDLIEIQNQGNNQGDYPSDLNVFIGKEMLFKVEVTDGNLAHGWRNYSVKRSSDDVDLIGRFKVLHNAKSCAEEVVVEDRIPETLEDVGQSAPLEKQHLEVGDSTNGDISQAEVNNTPCSKLKNKRSSEDVETPLPNREKGDLSTNSRKTKSVKIKTEKLG